MVILLVMPSQCHSTTSSNSWRHNHQAEESSDSDQGLKLLPVPSCCFELTVKHQVPLIRRLLLFPLSGASMPSLPYVPLQNNLPFLRIRVELRAISDKPDAICASPIPRPWIHPTFLIQRALKAALLFGSSFPMLSVHVCPPHPFSFFSRKQLLSTQQSACKSRKFPQSPSLS